MWCIESDERNKYVYKYALPQLGRIFHFDCTSVTHKTAIFVKKIDAFVGVCGNILKLILLIRKNSIVHFYF